MDSDFHSTRWTLVLRARGDDTVAKTALSELCEAYYAPVVAFLQRDGRNEDAAREMAHAFFESLLAKGVGTPEPGCGRFRSYLIGALKHFLSKKRDAALAAKRGAGAEHVSLLTEVEAAPVVSDDTLVFDRAWALTLIDRALTALEEEQAGKSAPFDALKPWLDGGASESQAELAGSLGMSETAVKVAIHRLRVRFRELIRSEIAATVNDPADAADELRHLIAVASAK